MDITKHYSHSESPISYNTEAIHWDVGDRDWLRSDN